MPKIFPIITKTTVVSGGDLPPGASVVSDAFGFEIKLAETNPAPVDAMTFEINLEVAETNLAPIEAFLMEILAIQESNPTPTVARDFTLLAWLSANTMQSSNGVTNPANANGQNNATLATYQSAALGDANPRTVAQLGLNLPAGVSVVSAIVRCWFRSVNTLVTSDGRLTLRSIGALFAEATIFSNAALNTTVDRLDGSFTYDLIANGINTLAKIQSIEFLAFTSDAVAGVTPHVLTLDAACIELAGAFV